MHISPTRPAAPASSPAGRLRMTKFANSELGGCLAAAAHRVELGGAEQTYMYVSLGDSSGGCAPPGLLYRVTSIHLLQYTAKKLMPCTTPNAVDREQMHDPAPYCTCRGSRLRLMCRRARSPATSAPPTQSVPAFRRCATSACTLSASPAGVSMTSSCPTAATMHGSF